MCGYPHFNSLIFVLYYSNNIKRGKVRKNSYKGVVNNKVLLLAKNRWPISYCSIESQWRNVKQSEEQGVPLKLCTATRHYVWSYPPVDKMSFFSPLKSCIGYEGCCPYCDSDKSQQGQDTATDAPFLDSDPLISKVMGEGSFHFVISVSNAVLSLATSLCKRDG